MKEKWYRVSKCGNYFVPILEETRAGVDLSSLKKVRSNPTPH
jgi:hypothetical protein